MAIQARTTEWELPEEVGEVVHVSPKKGFRCVNKEQPQGKTCSNYHIRFLCPLGECPDPAGTFFWGMVVHTHCCAHPLLSLPPPPAAASHPVLPQLRLHQSFPTSSNNPPPQVPGAGHRPGGNVPTVELGTGGESPFNASASPLHPTPPL